MLLHTELILSHDLCHWRNMVGNLRWNKILLGPPIWPEAALLVRKTEYCWKQQPLTAYNSSPSGHRISCKTCYLQSRAVHQPYVSTYLLSLLSGCVI